MIVYLARNRTNEKGYVGKTKRALEQRVKEHLKAARDGADQLFARAIRKHGSEAFEWSVLVEVPGDSEDDLDAREREMIAFYETHGPKGYNLTDGGEGVRGLKHTEDAKRRMSINRSGAKNGNWGGLSEEHKCHVSEGRRGKGMGNKNAQGFKHTEEARQKIGRSQYVAVTQYDMDGIMLATFSSMIEAEQKTGVGRTGISRCCRFPHRTASGFRFRYVD